MKILLTLTTLLFYTAIFGANRFWVASSSSNWNNTANWSTVSGGAGGASVPGAADVAIFNSNGLGNCNLDITPTIGGLTVNGYSAIIDLDGNNFSVGAGNITLSTGTIDDGLNMANLTINTTGTTTFSGTTIAVPINCTSGSLLLNGSVFSSTATFTKTGTINDVSLGGNTFSTGASITNTGSGYLLFGNSNADLFNGPVTINNTGSDLVYIAHNSTGNIINGNLTCNNFGAATGIRMANNTASAITVNGNVVFNVTGSGNNSCRVGDNGDVVITGSLDYLNTSTAAQTNFYIATASNSSVQIDGITTISNAGTGSSNQRVFLGENGDVTFNGDLIITNNSNAVNSQVYLSRNGNSNNLYNENIILESISASSDGVRFGESGGTGILAAGKTITVGVAGYTAGPLTFRNFTQIGSTPQNLTLTAQSNLVILDADFGGNVNFTAPRLTTRGSSYQGTTNLTKNGTGSDNSNGGNTFTGDFTFTNSGSGDVSLGNNNPDIFSANAQVTNSGTGNFRLANNSAGNMIGGDLTVLNSGNGNNISISGASASTIAITGNVTITDISAETNHDLYLGENGDVTIVGDLTLTNTSPGTSCDIIVANSTDAQVSVAGNTIATNNGTGATTSRIWLGINGDCILHDLTINNLSGATNSGVFLNNSLNSSNTYNGDIVMVANNSASDGIRFGDGGGNGTLASGRTITIGAGGFVAGDLRFRNFTQLGSTAQSLSITGTARLINEDSNWEGAVNFDAPRLLTRGTTYGDLADLEKTGGIADDVSVGGNTFEGNAILRNSGDNYIMMGSGMPDDFQANLDIINNGSAEIYLAHNSTGNLIGGDLNVAMSGVALRVELCDNTNSSLTVIGNTIITNSSTASTNQLIFGDNGDIDFNGSVNVTTTSGGINSYVYFANNTNSLVTTDGTFTFNQATTATGSTISYLGNQGDMIFNQPLTIINSSAANSSPIYCNHNASSNNTYNHNIILSQTIAGGDGIRFGQANGTGILAANRAVTIGAGGFLSGDLQFRNFTQIGPTAQNLTLTGTGRLINYDSNWGGDVVFVAPRISTRGTTYNLTSSLEKTSISDDISSGGNTFGGNCSLTNSGDAYFLMGNGSPDTWQGDLTIVNSGTDEFYLAHNSSGNTIAGTLDVTMSNTASRVEICDNANSTLVVTDQATVTNASTGVTNNITLGENGDIDFDSNLLITNNSGGSNSRIILGRGANSTISVDGFFTFNQNTTASNDTRAYIGDNGDVTFNGVVTVNNSSNASNSQIYLNHTGNSSNIYNENIILSCTAVGSDGIRFGESNGSGVLAATKTVTISAAGFVSGDLEFRNFTQIGPTAQSLTCTGSTRIYNYDSNWGGDIVFIAPRILTRGTSYSGTSYLEKNGSESDDSFGGNTFVGNAQMVNSGSSRLNFGTGQADIWQSNLVVDNSGTHQVIIASNSVGNSIAGTLNWNHASTGIQSDILANSTGSDLTVSGAATFDNTGSAGSDIFVGNAGSVTFNSTFDLTHNPTGPSTAIFYIAQGTSSTVSIAGNVNIVNTGAAATSDVYLGSSGDVNLQSNLTINNNGAGNSSRAFLANSTNSALQIDGTATITNNGSAPNDCRIFVGNQGDVTFNGLLNLINNSGSNLSHIYCNNGLNSIGVYNGNIIVETTSTTSDGVRFGEGGGIGTLAANQTVTVGSGGFVSGDLQFRNFTQVGPTDQTLTCTGTARIYNYDANWGGNITFIAPRMNTRGTTYNQTSFLEKTGAANDVSPGGNLFLGNAQLINSGTDYFMMGNGNADVWQGNLTVINSGSDNMYIAQNSIGNLIAGTLNWTQSGNGVNSYLANATNSNLLVSGAATFLNSSNAASCNMYIGTSGDITFNNSVDATNTTTGTGSGYIRIAESTNSMVTIAGATNLINNGSSTTSGIIVGNNGDADFGGTLNMVNAGSGTNSFFYLGNSSNSTINVSGNATLTQLGGITTTRSYLGSSSTNTYNGDLTITNASSSNNSEVYLNRATSAVSTFNGNITVTSENATCDGVRFGQDGGSAALANGQTISVGAGGFIAGDLRFRNFTQIGSTNQNILCTGSARIFQQNSAWNGATTFSSPRYYTLNTTYNADANITKTGASSDDSPGGNTFNGNTIITNSGTARLRFSTSNGNPDDYNGNVTLIKNNTGTIEPSYNNTDTYFGDISINANSPIYFGQSTNGRVLLDGNLGDQNINDLGSSPTPLFRDFQVNKSTGEVNLNIPIEITVNLDLDNGVVNATSANLVYLRDNAFVSSVSDASHIDGPVEKIGNDAFIFPVGDSSLYRPISMSNPSSGSARFRAEYINDDPHPTYDDNSKDASLNHISSCEYWTLDRIASSNNVSVSLSWDTPTSCGVDNLPELAVARWDGTSWRDEGNGGTTGNATSGTVMSLTAITNFSPFTLASTTFNNPLPIELLDFNAVLIVDEVTINWTTITETQNDYFEVERSANGQNWEPIKLVDGAGNSVTEITYETTDKAPLLGVSYYRLKQVDFNGDFSYSEVQSVNYKWSTKSELIIYPNPTNNVIFVKGANEELQTIELYDSFGKRLLAPLIFNNSEATINLTNYEAGVYFVKTANSTHKIIKH